ncbi:hypothetical protein, partial [Comamonas composti]|uniref:hypothetical protein n=1 Tax=Comamonas composti TaxID=408558 RepID=UPI001B7F7EF4
VIDFSRFGLLSGHFYGKKSRLANCSKNRGHFFRQARHPVCHLQTAEVAQPTAPLAQYFKAMFTGTIRP